MEKKFSSLFVFDLDGTLVHTGSQGQREIPKNLQACLHELSRKAYVIVATGRRVRTAQLVLPSLPKLPFLICHNGLLVLGGESEVVHRRSISFEEAIQVSYRVRDCGLSPILVMDGQREGLDFVMERRDFEEDESLSVLKEKAKDSCHCVESFEFLTPTEREHILEVAALAPYAQLLEAQAFLKSQLPEVLRPMVVKTVGYTGLSVLEIFDAASSKWSGVELVRERLSVDHIVAIGDDENDIEMLKNADVGIAMAHAEAHVLAASTARVDGPEGLQLYLEKEWLK